MWNERVANELRAAVRKQQTLGPHLYTKSGGCFTLPTLPNHELRRRASRAPRPPPADKLNTVVTHHLRRKRGAARVNLAHKHTRSKVVNRNALHSEVFRRQTWCRTWTHQLAAPRGAHARAHSWHRCNAWPLRGTASECSPRRAHAHARAKRGVRRAFEFPRDLLVDSGVRCQQFFLPA